MGADIKAPAQKIFDYLTDPNKIPSILPGLIENTNVPALPLQVGSKFDYKYQMYGVMLDGTWEVTEIESPSKYSANTTGGIDSKWHYDIAEKDGGSHVVLTVEYSAPDSVLGKVKFDALKKVNEKEAEHLLHNLQTILEMQGE